MNGEVLGHVPPAPITARKHRKNPFQGGDFWCRGGGRIALELVLGFGARRVGEDGFRKKDDGKMSRLTNRVSRLKTMSPWEVCGIYKFAIESTHGGRLMKFRNSGKIQINSKKIQNFGRRNFAQ